ncbi:MAG: M20/M25/M40 family metallo-hydrolase [Clostridia bacterium]|nr:M20/M25/M40 family metallo-hydrolase [Clostridia bacterium]
MKEYDLTELLFDLCKSVGVSGNESEASEKAMKYLSEYMPCETDALGSVIGKKEGKGINILLDAHIDQIGLVVTSIDDKGFLHVAKCGGADVRVMSSSEVTVWGKKKLFGVIASIPPHLADENEKNKAVDFDNLFIDIGMSKTEAEEFVTPGDRITFNGTQAKLLNNNVVSPCIDDRAGVAAILRCMQILKNSDKPLCGLTVMFSSQEETGGSGAVAGAFKSNADEAIAVDVGFAKAPGIKEEKAGRIGGGAMIGIAPSLDFDMSKTIISLAEKNSIKWQYDVMGGNTGTNGDEISATAGGIKTALISIPIKNMHTAVEIANIDDIEATAQLLAAYILERSDGNA